MAARHHPGGLQPARALRADLRGQRRGGAPPRDAPPGPFGSLERFIGILIEHFAGDFPLWLAPVQAVVVPVSEKQEDYAREVAGRLKEAGLRAEADTRPERMQARIRDAEVQKVPYILVVGEREKAEGAVSVRRRKKGNLGTMPLAAFLEGALREYRERRLEPVF